MLENYFNLLSVGCQVPPPEVVYNLEQGGKQCVLDGETSNQSCLDRDVGFKTVQQGMSEKVSIKFERIDLFTRDDPYFILELWRDNDQTGGREENQDQRVSHIAFINKETLADEKDCEHKDIVNPNFIPSRKRPCNYNSLGKV
uniref:KRAB domain-containing protein n=1 Tax=Molossus molossus TaxID=27622 RepID=A0A7J8B8J5_MOLMO|nr:hypothetical protein HJG59_010492 [Molossus molossus]